MPGSPFGFDFMFTVFPVIFIIFFVLIVGVIIAAVVRSITRSVKNQNSPILSVDARIATKRTDTSGGAGDTSAWTHYYATFEVASGDRLEFQISGEQSGLLAEGDEGKLTFQGTRYVSFERRMSQ